MQLGINKGNRCQICGGLLWGNVEHTGDFNCQGHPITQRTYSEQDLLDRIKYLEDGIKWACDNPQSVFVFNELKKLISNDTAI